MEVYNVYDDITNKTICIEAKSMEDALSISELIDFSDIEDGTIIHSIKTNSMSKEQELIKAVKELLKAVESSTIDLWADDNFTKITCVVLEDVDPESTKIEGDVRLEGERVTELLSKLEKLIQ